MDVFEGLNEQQCEAVGHMYGPLLILAGAGSGKTRVITRRVAHLINQGVPQERILAITFTNKAANEMRDRIRQLVLGCHVWISTFHKFCVRLLRSYGGAVGLRSGFVIYDTADQKRLLKHAMAAAEVSSRFVSLDHAAHVISNAKNDLVGTEAFARAQGGPNLSPIAAIYHHYQAELLKANAVDFDDLLVHVANLLRNDPELRAQLDAQYEFILVDEYQDTNMAQYAILRGLAIDHPNLCATGDPDQSIYGWRGANIGNILSFEQDFPGTRVVRLEKNYRSTGRILQAANRLIQFNRDRKPKSLIPVGEPGVPVRVVSYADERDEATSIAREIREAVASGRRRWKDFAIFCRTGALTRAVELALREQGLPFRILSGVGFFDRKEVKDLLAYLKLVVNPSDDVAFERIVNVPARGIGNTTLAALRQAAAQRGHALLETAAHVAGITPIKQRQAKPLREFYDLIQGLATIRDHHVEEIIRQVLERTNYFPAEDDPMHDDERRANVEELITAAKDYDDSASGDLEQFLAETMLATDVDQEQASDDYLSIMTLHAAKGLEFPVIYCIAVEHGILPHSRSQTSSRLLEEERRLLFVGMTRAKEELSLSHTSVRNYRGRSESSSPSQFLQELATAAEIRPQLQQRRERRATGRIQSGAEFASTTPPAQELAVGSLVCHEDYGMGRVTAVNGYGSRRKATVEFQLGGTRTFMLNQARLIKIK